MKLIVKLRPKKLIAHIHKSPFSRCSERLYRVLRLSKHECTSPVKVGILRRLRLWSHGFLGESYVIYDLKTNEIKNYLSDYSRWVRTPDINSKNSIFLTNKLLFSKTLIKKGYKTHLPEIYSSMHILPFKTLVSLLKEKNRLVLKPISGGGGYGLLFFSKEGNTIYLNQKEETEETIKALISNLRNQLIQEYITQAKYSSEIFPKTTNTIRIVTMWDIQKNTPFIAIAVHRIGTANSFPVDNWTQGGLSAEINLQTGKIGKAVTFPNSGELIWHKGHPFTGSKIEGVFVPHWSHIKSEILAIAHSLPFIPYIGWDIVVTQNGFKIIEGNNYTDVNLLQVHRPLLLDQRIVNFYKKYKVI